jgi:adenylylsulfate kinase-like enzyme
VPEEPQAVLITGVYGSGKSSVAAEIADILEKRAAPYALIELDYLAWANVPGAGYDDPRLLLANLASVRRKFVRAGVRQFVLAGFVRDESALEQIRVALGMPARVVRLEVPLDEIERRLASDVTSGRKDDLREAREQLARSQGVGVEELGVANDRPVRVVAMEILEWLAWR